jgi:hypothetical protein
MPFIWSYRSIRSYAEVRSSERDEVTGLPKSLPIYLGKVIDLENGSRI